jgi:DNA-cytosine methyltransferase
MKLKHLDLFSGIGGFSLGLESTGGFETVAFCDYDSYCQKVLRKHWPWVTIYDDVKELNSERLEANGHTKIDIITGGYPCQPFSIAGRQKGEQDPRHVWPEYFRLIKELRPTWVIGENVAGHIKLGLDTVLENLESEGYSARAFSISASSVGAVHQRERVWIVGYSEHNGSSTTEKSRVSEKTDDNSKEGQNKTIQFERTGGSHNSEDVENTRCSQWPWSFFGNQDEDETREGDAYQFERSGSTSKIDVADSESSGRNEFKGHRPSGGGGCIYIQDPRPVNSPLRDWILRPWPLYPIHGTRSCCYAASIPFSIMGIYRPLALIHSIRIPGTISC